MTSTSGTDTVLAGLQARLAEHLDGGTIDLTDDILGIPLLDPVLHQSALTVRAVQVDATVPAQLGLVGTVDLLGASGASIDLRIEDDGQALAAHLAFTAADASPLRLSAVLSSIADGVVAPPEVPDLGLGGLSLDVTPSTGAFTASGTCDVPWSLPFGGAGLQVGTAALTLARTEADALTVGLALSSAGALPVADGFEVTAFGLTFTHGGDGWTLGGTLQALVLDAPFTLAAALDEQPGRREFSFSTTATSTVSADLAGVGSLAFGSVTVLVTRSLGPAGGGTAGTAEAGQGGGGTPDPGVRLDPHAEYSWSVEASGHLDLLDRAVVLDGTLAVQGEPGTLTVALRPGTDGRGAELSVPLPGASSVVVHLGLDTLEVTRAAAPPAGGASSWTVAAEVAVWFGGLPGNLASVLPGSRDGEVTGALRLVTGAEAAVVLSVEPVLPLQPFHVPDVDVAGSTIHLSQATSAVEVSRLEVRWARGGGLDVTAGFGIGIPAVLNEIFGAGSDVLVGYVDGDPGTLQRLTLSASATTGEGGGPSLSLHPLTSPFRHLTFSTPDPGSDERTATADLGACGTLALTVPSIEVSGDVFRAKGGFSQTGLALPLSPVRKVMDMLGLGAVNRFLPDHLPLADLHLYDAVKGLDADAVLSLVTGPLQQVGWLDQTTEQTLRSALDGLAGAATKLPERLVPYLNVTIPRSLSFDLSVSAAGGILGGVSVAAPGATVPLRSAEPLRLLLPGLSATGPVLTGIELWNLQIGEVLDGAALLVRADLNVDQFDLIPLAALIGLSGVVPDLADPVKQTRRLVADQLTMIVVPEAAVAFPLFFDDLAIEYRGPEGADLGAHLSFPEPRLDLARALDIWQQLKAFLTDRQALLDETTVGSHGLDLELTAGPAYLKLPDYLGGSTYGSRTATSTVSAAAGLAHLLNGLKRLDLGELLQALPGSLLHATADGQASAQLGPLSFAAGWDVGTPPNAPHQVEIALHGTAGLAPLADVATRLTVRTVGSHGVGVSFGADARLGPAAAILHLDGAVTSPAPAPSAAPGGVLQLADPGARVTTPGPTWTPRAFTVEWWMRPTQLWDYNQFVSGAAVWGSWVFHATASGAAYCGTDVATRLTPADLPPGTVQPGVWQHFAFAFQDGIGILYRNGLQVALKTGMTAPAPWTGLHLGIPDAGTQVDGAIAELRVWDYLRPIQEIQSTLHQRLTGEEQGLVACWPLDDGVGTVLRDVGPSRLDGSAAGATWVPASSDAAAPLASAGAAVPAVAADLRGTSWIEILGRRVFDGTVHVTPQQASLDGILDLFPGSTVLQVRGRLGGAVAAGSFRLDGGAAVNLAGLTLALAKISVTQDGVALGGRWLGLLTGDLQLVAAGAQPRLTGTLTGRFGVDVQSGAVRIPTPDPGVLVKLTDGFRITGSASVTVALTADEATGVALSGTAVLDVQGQEHTVHFSLPGVPTMAAQLRTAVENAALDAAAAVFTGLFPTARDWLAGQAAGAFTWTRDTVDAVGSVLKNAYQTSAPDAQRLLQQAGHGVVDIGTALRAYDDLLADRGARLLQVLQDAGYSVEDVGRGLGAALAPGGDPLAQATAAVHAMSFRLSALEQIRVPAVFGLSLTDAMSILFTQSSFDLPTLARTAANGVYRAGRDATFQALTALTALGVGAADVARAVAAVFG